MTDYSRLFSALEEHVRALDERFIHPHLPLLPHTSPDSYDLDVRGFCVLAHAAFEQFVEDVCEGLAQDASHAWLHKKYCSHSLLALLAFKGDRIPIEEDETKLEVPFSTHIREAIEATRKAFATTLRMHNHGVSVKYLRKMLLPVGLDVPDNPNWLAALAQLAKQRGDSAHKAHVKKVLAPDDARTCVRDCLEMFAKIRDDSKSAFQRPYFVEDDQQYVI